ncbi:MAG: transketolase [Bacteroidota bacterium]|jgi:transketolase
MEIVELKNVATQVRRDILRMVHAVQSGHPGGSLGCTDFFVALYGNVMNYTKGNFNMEGKGEDVFYLSNGHISPVWYSTLARIAGYFPVSELGTFRKLNTRLQGHPATHEKLPGVRVASGSLGQGLSVAIGHALAKKGDGDLGIVYSLHGDGELQEGQIWEAAMFASAHKVDNIISTVDVNGQQIDGATDKVLPMGDLRAKFESFGWKVMEMDGGDMGNVISVLSDAKKQVGKGYPVMILMRTEMGNGVDFMMGTHKWHGVAPNDEQLEKALSQLPQTIGDY